MSDTSSASRGIGLLGINSRGAAKPEREHPKPGQKFRPPPSRHLPGAPRAGVCEPPEGARGPAPAPRAHAAPTGDSAKEQQGTAAPAWSRSPVGSVPRQTPRTRGDGALADFGVFVPRLPLRASHPRAGEFVPKCSLGGTLPKVCPGCPNGKGLSLSPLFPPHPWSVRNIYIKK